MGSHLAIAEAKDGPEQGIILNWEEANIYL